MPGNLRLLNKSQSLFCYAHFSDPAVGAYGVSFYETQFLKLIYMAINGIQRFLEKEEGKWKCPDCGDMICCHNGICFSCGLEKLRNKKNLYRWEDDCE